MDKGERTMEVLYWLALGSMWGMIFFVPISLVCLNASKTFSVKTRFELAWAASVIFIILLISHYSIFAVTGMKSSLLKMDYHEAVWVTCALGFCLIAHKLAKKAKLKMTDRYGFYLTLKMDVVYLIMIFSLYLLIIKFSQLIKWHL